MLSIPWEQRQKTYDIVVIGSGYGGAITAARLATANLPNNPSICILERGREWEPGTFPEDVPDVVGAMRSGLNPLGLYELLNYPDISVLKGSGLGGTSLVNANVAIVPDEEVFAQFNWPKEITYAGMQGYYDTARGILAATEHPHAMDLRKVQALDIRAREMGTRVEALKIAVNFTIDGPNPYGIEQKPCINCGNCVTGCNVRAKNTLYMNYLPMAKNAGASILTQVKVEYLEKLAGGGWRIHGKHVTEDGSDKLDLVAGEVVLAAGALNSAEILLRSEAKSGLSVSPALGTKFSGNGDFFGLAYNCDPETDVLGYKSTQRPRLDQAPEPGPNIVGIVRYTNGVAEAERISVEDFSFPSSSVIASRAVFGGIRGIDTVTGNEAAQKDRLNRDLKLGGDPYDPNGALNHTMLYLVMGMDNARGVILYEEPWTEPDGRIKVSWDQGGQQQIFTRMNSEIRRHAHALRGNFIANPTWNFLNIRHLITAHPLGGCPMGDDHYQGAVDIYGRVYAGDGSVHKGLYVTDGSVVPSALGVNPFLTISALTERFAELKIAGNYPDPPTTVNVPGIDSIEAIDYSEDQLEALFRRCPTMPIATLVNKGGAPQIDKDKEIVRNDLYWKGFFPKGHILNAMSSAIFTGFKKEFHFDGSKYTGITSDTDGRIHARNSLEAITIEHGKGGTLEPGNYVLLRYLDPPWQGFYDIFKIINEDLLIGRVYLGEFPHGARVFTFPMVRRYSFAQMTVDDHNELYAQGSVPSAEVLNGVWRMDTISNANHASSIAYLQLSNQPDGRIEARYQVLGLMEGLVIPSFLSDHFQLNDFTPFHDEIRRVSDDFLVGKYMAPLPAGLSAVFGNTSLGLFHTEGANFGFYYMLTRTTDAQTPSNTLLAPFLDVQLPDGVGMTFDETMVGWYFPGQSTPAPGHDGDLTIADRIPASGDPAGAVSCTFTAHMVVADVNEFIDGYEHEAQIKGTIAFGIFDGSTPATYPIDETNSRFHYLRVNPATAEAEMRYHIEFVTTEGDRYAFDGTKYMQKDQADGGVREVLDDYTTLYCHVTQQAAGGAWNEIGIGLLKFKTFEDLAAVGNLTGFLASFQITGNGDPAIQLQARLRFLAFTGQFVQREYDPLAPPKQGQ